MKTKKTNVSLLLITTMVLSILAIMFFPSVKNPVFADTTTRTITFTYNGETIKTITLEDGESLKEKDFPIDKLPTLNENDMYIWSYTTGETFNTIKYGLFTGDPEGIILPNVTSDITLSPKAVKNPSKTHEVVFMLPDGSSITMLVYNGEDCQEPDVPLGFCERVNYSASLKNIRENMTIKVTIDRTMKYIFLIGCGTALLASIVVIVIVILKVVNAPDDDDDEDMLVTETATTSNATRESQNLKSDQTAEADIQNNNTNSTAVDNNNDNPNN